jgi:hypothetical protein
MERQDRVHVTHRGQIGLGWTSDALAWFSAI